MKRLVLERFLWLVPTLVLAAFGIFWLVHLGPGDPAVTLAGQNATARQIAAIREQLGLNQPFLVQYWHWLTHAVSGNLGTSLNARQSVASAIGEALPVTLQLVTGGLLVAAIAGTVAGVVSSRRANTTTDAAVASLSSAGAAIPSFWLGQVLVSLFALGTHWFPATGFVSITSNPAQAVKDLVLPSLALGISDAAEIARQLRAVLIEILASDHIRTLRAKGAATWRPPGRQHAEPSEHRLLLAEPIPNGFLTVEGAPATRSPASCRKRCRVSANARTSLVERYPGADSRTPATTPPAEAAGRGTRRLRSGAGRHTLLAGSFSFSGTRWPMPRLTRPCR